MNNANEQDDVRTIRTSSTSKHRKPTAPRKFPQSRKSTERSFKNDYLLLAKRTQSNIVKTKNIYLSKYKLLEASIENALVNKENRNTVRSKKASKTKTNTVNTSIDKAGGSKGRSSKGLLEELLVRDDNKPTGSALLKVINEEEVGRMPIEEEKMKTLQDYFRNCKYTPKAEKVRKSREVNKDDQQLTETAVLRRKLK
jgi:hypothetical protein